MAYFTTTDGTRLFYKDWGPRDGQPDAARFNADVLAFLEP